MHFLVTAAADYGPGEVFKLVLGGAIFAELVGVPVAWMRLRRTGEWANRPEGMRSLELLARFVKPVTGFAAAWGLVVALSALVAAGVA